MTSGSILVIDDEQAICDVLSVILSKESYQVSTVMNAHEALELLRYQRFDLILSDIRMPDMDGVDLLKKIKKQNPHQLVIMMTAFGTLENAVEAMREGAYDYLSKPIKAKEIVLHVKKAFQHHVLFKENIYLKKVVQDKFSFDQIVGKSAELLSIFHTVSRIAPYKSAVLITGESGTGKELIAKSIHYNSLRKDKPFVAINCGAIPNDLLESELFGHLKGSFTGAHSSKRGLFEEADGGTLFLDEIADISEASQVKLLRALQEEEIRPIGSNRTIPVDVRIISATEQVLPERIATGQFRESLYYRLNVVHIEVPPLRQRTEDIPLLAHHFLKKWAHANNVEPTDIAEEAMEVLLHYQWPGNVRELENVIERAALMAEGKQITLEHLPQNLQSEKKSVIVTIPNSVSDMKAVLKEASRQIEITMIDRALKKTDNNRTHAARLLNISHRSLLYKLKEYGLDTEPPAS